MWCLVLNLFLATLLFPWIFGAQMKSIPIPVFSYILSARTTHRKHSSSIVAYCRPHIKHVSRFTCQNASLLVGQQGWAWRELHRKHNLIYCCVLDRVYRAVNALVRSFTLSFVNRHIGEDGYFEPTNGKNTKICKLWILSNLVFEVSSKIKKCPLNLLIR
jgi:hypothetical protein